MGILMVSVEMMIGWADMVMILMMRERGEMMIIKAWKNMTTQLVGKMTMNTISTIMIRKSIPMILVLRKTQVKLILELAPMLKPLLIKMNITMIVGIVTQVVRPDLSFSDWLLLLHSFSFGRS